MKQLHTYNHPLIQCELTRLRDKNTLSSGFRQTIHRLTRYLVYEAAANHPIESKSVETPMNEAYTGVHLNDQNVVLAPVLRAGLCMIEGASEVFTEARIRHIGLYRDEETLEPVEYYNKMPAALAPHTIAYVLDPMLATGGSAIAALDILKKRGVKTLHFLCLIAAPEGVQALQAKHPDVSVHTTAVDERLNEQGFIVPGLGDAGDRAFNTL